VVLALGIGFGSGALTNQKLIRVSNPVSPTNNFTVGHLEFTLPQTWKRESITADNVAKFSIPGGEVTLTFTSLTPEEIADVEKTGFIERQYAILGGKVLYKVGEDFIVFQNKGYRVGMSASGVDLGLLDIDLLDLERSARWKD